MATFRIAPEYLRDLIVCPSLPLRFVLLGLDLIN